MVGSWGIPFGDSVILALAFVILGEAITFTHGSAVVQHGYPGALNRDLYHISIYG